jgi:DNA mismatch repair protein MutS
MSQIDIESEAEISHETEIDDSNEISEDKIENEKLYNQYFKWQIEFQEKYGEKTLVICEVGSFFEIYTVDNDKEKIGVGKEVSKLLNIQYTSKNKKKPGNHRKNPKMCGFQPPYLHRHLEILLENNWTVVIIEQVTPKPNITRAVTRICSPGTYIDYTLQPDNNYVVSIFMDKLKDSKKKADILAIGLSALDASTGQNTIYCFYSYESVLGKTGAYLNIEEEIMRFLGTYNPKEIILNSNQISKDYLAKIISVIQIGDRRLYQDTIKSSKDLFQINYQNQYLGKIFKKSGQLEALEYLNLDEKPAATISYIYLLKFVEEHCPKIIEKLYHPEEWSHNINLILKNNTIYQLDILPVPKNDTNQKYRSLLDLIDQTKTSMGKRLLRHQLLNPIIDVNEIERRYNNVESLMNKNDIRNFRGLLDEVMDLERSHRKLFLKMLQPYEWAELEMTYHAIITLLDMCKDKLDWSNILVIKQLDIDKFKEYVDNYSKIFKLDEMLKYSYKNLEYSFFREGNFAEIDEIQNKINKLEKEINKITKKLSNYIGDNYDYVTLENSKEKDSYFFKITTISRANILKKALPQDEFDKYIFRNSGKNGTKIYLKDNSLFDELEELKDKLKEPLIKAYYDTIDNIYQKYLPCLQGITAFIAELDVYVSHAKTAMDYSYNRPKIVNKLEGISYLDTKALRHPLAERINNKENYVPNDVSLGMGNIDGMLLFGINSAGKSCLLKSLGLATIMAQAGMYVPANSFEYYPFTTLYTRISGDDNIFKSKSSFMIEMHELANILKYSNSMSLVLGDEICKGTENISALSIVASSLKWLSKNNVKFLLATHLHHLTEMESVKSISNISLKHLKIQYNANEEYFIYDRQLKDGSGDAIYGLEVAKNVINDKEFIGWATEIRNSLLDTYSVLGFKKSSYNKEIYQDVCQVCGGVEGGIDQHHIIYQSHCKDGFHEHIPKNNPSNLVFLCKKHHVDVHQDRLTIEGYQNTSDGKKLVFHFNNINEIEEKKIAKLKFSPEQIELTKKLHESGLSNKLILFKLRKEHNIEMSMSTFHKIIKNTYT